MLNLENSLSTKRILIVDDLVEARSSLKNMMGIIGAQRIDTATDGREAMELILENDYDLVLSDYNLGKGKDGQQILEEARFSNRLKATAQFILVTGENAVERVMGALEYEPDAYITKPFTLSMLRERLKRIFHTKEELRPINEAIDNGDINQAIEIANFLLESKPRLLLPVSRILGKLYMREERYEEALHVYSQPLNTRMVSWARLGQAICMHYLGDSLGALALIRQTLVDYPMYVQCHDWAARILLALGKPEEAQEQLELATAISPRAVLRQMELGYLASQNGDHKIAETAFEQSIRLGRHSCYKTSGNYLQFARELQHGLSAGKTRDNINLRNKALRAIDELRQEYSGHVSIMFDTSIVESKTYVAVAESDKAKGAADRAESLLARIQAPTPDQQLQMTEAFIDVGEHIKAKDLINTMRDSQASNLAQNALDKLRALEDKLNAMTIREHTAKLNAEGVSLYEQGKLMEAIEVFDQAVKYDEVGVSVLLNAIQAKVSHIERTELDVRQLKDCYVLFKRIGSIGHLDERYDRYDRLKTTCIRLKRAAGV
ncbi:tetratricopeptide repeat-containing response regulator [Thalassolituus oleivorans]|uniref:tetratricopeptide repeat-containing response regulator n=1 Tax=Thalassolituus oleivorans TaxID=187493 RepID=UPI0023F54D1B|nr:tetratricopeptide repeat-containing response regulator [Thalassolituus oleivorans]